MEEKNIIVTDHEADESLKSLATGKLVQAVEFSQSCRGSLTGNNTISCNSSSKTADGVEIKLLRVIIEHPMQPSSQYSKLAGISPNTFRKVRPVLKDKGLISEHKLQANTRGRSTILLGPTEQGKKHLSDYDSNKRTS